MIRCPWICSEKGRHGKRFFCGERACGEEAAFLPGNGRSKAMLLLWRAPAADGALIGRENMQLSYEELAEQLEALLDPDWPAVSNLSNAASILYNGLERINWAGFYLMKGDVLWLGPFGGRPACVRIETGKGVCGEGSQPENVPDVHQFPGHIACDGASRSEIVVPLVRDGRVLGVLDLDSPEYARFGDADRIGLERIAAILLRMMDRELL